MCPIYIVYSGSLGEPHIVPDIYVSYKLLGSSKNMVVAIIGSIQGVKCLSDN